MLNVVGMIEGGTMTPIMTEEDGIMTGDALLMTATIIHPDIQTVHTTIVPIMVDILGGRFSLTVNGMERGSFSRTNEGGNGRA